jgi:hypothetical protein
VGLVVIGLLVTMLSFLAIVLFARLAIDVVFDVLHILHRRRTNR